MNPITDHEENVEIMKDLRNRLDAVIKGENKSKVPDPTKHLYVSMAKSVIRVVAGIALIAGSLTTAGALLIVAELLGIAEELV
jgi:hypothetical protein